MLGCSRQGFYGDNCTLRCPSNCRETQCNLITGHCTSCVPGYYGLSCNQGMHVFFIFQINVLLKYCKAVSKLDFKLLERFALRFNFEL